MANKPQVKLKFYKGYGDNFRKIRTEKDYTLDKMSKIINFSDKTINAIETEKREPTIEQLNIYVEKFGVSLDYLTGRTKAMQPDVAQICEYTGLSENAVKVLNEFKNASLAWPTKGSVTVTSENELYHFNKLHSDMIESMQFLRIGALIKNYKDALNSFRTYSEKISDSEKAKLRKKMYKNNANDIIRKYAKELEQGGYLIAETRSVSDTLLWEISKEFERMVTKIIDNDLERWRFDK